MAWGGYEAGQKYGWWKAIHWPAWLQRHLPKAQALLVQPPPREEPLEFVTVDDPAVEAPKKAKYYSSQNSKAADQTGQKETDQPKLDGRQTEVRHLTDTLRPQFADPKPPAPKPSQEEQVAKPAQVAGDMTLGKAQPEQEARPRTLAEARAQMKQTPGVMSRQDGGAAHRALRASLDAIGTKSGAYDAAIVEAIQQFWYNELDSQKFALDGTGKVRIEFKLNYDGTVTELKETENTVGFELGLVCQEAISGPAPFAKWTTEMRQEYGNFRVITFTFYYY
jgi:outer membrane biosynthesis protein TonB